MCKIVGRSSETQLLPDEQPNDISRETRSADVTRVITNIEVHVGVKKLNLFMIYNFCILSVLLLYI